MNTWTLSISEAKLAQQLVILDDFDGVSLACSDVHDSVDVQGLETLLAALANYKAKG